MNLTDLQPRSLSPALGQIGPVEGLSALRTGSPGAVLNGNSLIGLDVWAGKAAGTRSFNLTGILPVSASFDIDQAVGHILAPLG